MTDASVDMDAVARLMSATGCDADQAQFLLEAANGNFEVARHMFLDAMGAGPLAAQAAASSTPPRPPPPTAPTPPRPPAPNAPQAAAAAAANRQAGASRAPLPLRMLWAGFGILGGLVRVGLSAAGTLGDLLLPATLMRVLRELAAALLPSPGGPSLDAAGQAQAFIQDFTARYGPTHPDFLPVSWREAAAAAHRELKFLFVYLHSGGHEDSAKFCRSVLCAPGLVAEAGQQFVCWGGDVRHSDAFQLAGRLQVATYPTVALLAYSGSRTQLIACVQGYCPLEQLLAVLATAISEQGAVLVVERADREERERSRQLLAEQNAEYEEALAADRAREAAAAEATRRRTEEEAAKAAAEAAVRAQAEAAERRKLEALASIDRRIAEAAATLPPEPSDAEPSAFIRVRLPDGSNHQRRFAASNTVQQLYRYVDSLQGCRYLKYSLVCGFPRKVYGRDTLQQTLEEGGLVPQGVLFVQPEEEDEEEEGAAQQPA